MFKKSAKWAMLLIMVLSIILSACGTTPAPTKEAVPEPTKEAVPEPTKEAAAPTEAPAAAGCPASTMADPMGLEGEYPGQFELAEFEKKAGCELVYSENPDIADLNTELNGADADLPPVEERLPSEPLVIQPYIEIGKYGGRLRGISKSPESGTSDFLSTRHVNLFRMSDDLMTIVPEVAKGWEFNDDYTELTVFLREGHKWSDGEPFTAEDIEFWFNDIHLNKDYFDEVSSFWVYGGEPMKVEAIDDTTVKFSFAAPAPNFVTFMAITYRQPWQPKHFLSQFHPEYNPDANANAQANGFDDWVGQFRLYYHDWKDTYHPFDGPEGTQFGVPTLESHVLVDETPEHRLYVTNPYFFMVDTAGNQLPYYNESYEIYSEDMEVQVLKLINGELDYRNQTLELPNYTELKQNEEKGGYRVFLPPAVGETVFYAFNITHLDPEMAKIYGDLRFRQAMSLAMNREEILEIVYLGQGEPQQELPVDASTVDFVSDEALYQFTEYDPDRANELLDEMGLTERDADGFRLRFDGEPFVILLQFAPQGGPVQTHELVKQYWEAVGVRVQAKEVTSDFYRSTSSSNQHDLATWRGASGSTALNAEVMFPPFGDYLQIRTGVQWSEWMLSDGAEGIEPPEDIKRLWDLAAEWKTYPLGSEENSRVGAEIVKIHADNLLSLGVIGSIPSPVYVNDRVGNAIEFTIKSYNYYWAYAFRPTQWFIKE
jgi:peptide/nickel transport system substrate-binding protein